MSASGPSGPLVVSQFPEERFSGIEDIALSSGLYIRYGSVQSAQLRSFWWLPQ